MRIGIYPPFDDTTKIGPVGPRGIGFDLTRDGNYDMNNKILKNCGSPTDDQDAANKGYVSIIERSLKDLNASFLNFVNETALKIQTLDKDMKKHYLFSQDGNIFDAKDRRIGNVKDPVDGKNVVNKRFMQKNALVLKGNVYDAGNKQISNVSDPINDDDASTKKFVLNEIENFNKNFELFVNSATNKFVDLDDKISDVMDRTIFTLGDKYDDRLFIIFNDVNSYYFEKNLKLKFDMTMIVTLFLENDVSLEDIKIDFRLSDKIEKTIRAKISNHYSNFSVILEGKAGDILSIRTSNDITKRYLKIEVLNFIS